LRKRPFNLKFRLPFLFAGVLVMIVVMVKTGATLKTPGTPKGILDLEFAYNAAKASVVINAWTGTGPVDNMEAAKINTRLDFIFLFFYSLFLYNTGKLLAACFHGSLLITGRFIARGALAAGLCDILENTGMLITLQDYLSDSCTLLTFIFSIAKWIMALAAALYILIAGLTLSFKKIRQAV
jgi:hypothetical protein